MLTVFETILEMSLTASIVILVVMLARMLLSKAPKKYAYLLWLVVAFRLCVPFSFESSISIFNTDAIPSFDLETSVQEQSSETVSDAVSESVSAPEASDEVLVPSVPAVPNQGTVSVPEQMPNDTPVTPPVSGETPSVPSTPGKPNDTPVQTPNDTPVQTPNDTPVEIPDTTVPATPSAPSTDWQNTLGVVLATVWALGILCMLGCGAISYIKLKKRLQNAVLLYDNVYGSDRIGSPFALGVFRPRIYIPFGLNEEAQGYILAHERYHLKRLDHLVKPLSFAILCVHWFNPLCWLAFNRMSLDMELSCDERVLKQYGDENMKKKYSKTLLDFATDNRYPTPAPISFSEGAGAKTRIKHALYWKKPRFWVSAIAILLCAVVLVACAANAVSNDPSDDTSDDTSKDEAPDRIIDFSDVPYQFTFTSNGDGTCVITDIKTDFDHTEKYDLVIPEKSPDGDKVVEVKLDVLNIYKDKEVFNVPGALTKETFSSIIGSIRTSEFKGANGITAEKAADIVDSFYGRPHGQPSDEHVDEFSYVILEPHICVEEASRISGILTDFIGYTAEDCYADCLAVMELDTSQEIAEVLKENAFRFFYHDVSNIQKVILPSKEITLHQGEWNTTFALADGTTFEPVLALPISVAYGNPEIYDHHYAEHNAFESVTVTALRRIDEYTFFALRTTDGSAFTVSEVFFSDVTLEQGQTSLLETHISETIPNRGIGYMTADGDMKYYAIRYDGKDGGLYFEDITDRITPPDPTTGEIVIASYDYNGGTLYHAELINSYNDRLYLIKDDGTRVDIREQLLFSYLAFSDDQSKLIWNDYEWERNATVCVYDMASGALTVQPMDDLGMSYTPSYMAWLDNRYFLFVSQYDMGTITTGGDLYVYDTETHLYRLLFDAERVGPRELMIHSFVTDGQNVTLRADVYDYDTDLYVDWTRTVTADSIYEMIKYGHSVTLKIDDGELLQKPPQVPNGETLITSFQLDDGYLYHTEDSDHNHVLRIMRYDGTVTEIDKRSYITNVCLNYQKDMLIWNDFAGEYNATVWVYDIDAGILTEQPMDDLGEDYTPSFMSWYDSRYFLFISQLDHGSIVRGGDVYVYDTDTHEYRMIIDAQDRLMFTSLDEYLYAVNYNEENDSYTEMFYMIYADLRELFENDQPLIVHAEDCREYVAPLDCPVEVVPTDKEPTVRFDGDASEVFEFTFKKDVKGFAIVKIDTGVAYDITVDPLGEPTDYKAGDTLVYSMYINDISDSRGFVLIGEDGKLHYYALRGPDMAGFSSDYSVIEVTDHPLLTVDGEIPDFNP